MATTPRWYALQVRPNYEMVVSSSLIELGVDGYLPINSTSVIPKRNKFAGGLPLFPGYVFARMDLVSGPRLYTISGLVRVLGNGANPTPIDDEEVEAIRTIVCSRLPIESTPYLVAGERIILTDGPLRGVRGCFMNTKRGGQLIVSLPLLHRSLAVTVPSDWVAREDTAFAVARSMPLSA